MPSTPSITPEQTKQLLKFLRGTGKDLGVGALYGVGAGAGAGLLRRLLTPTETTVLPEEDEEFEVLDSEKTAALQNANIVHLLGAVGGLGLGMKGVDYIGDKRRAGELDKTLSDQKKELQELLLEEQRLAKTASNPLRTPILKILTDVGEGISTAGAQGDSIAHHVGWPALGALLGVQQGYTRASKSDPDRARLEELKKSLLRRLGEDAGEGRGAPIVLKLKATGGKDTPLKPGASALVDPAKGRDIFSY